MLANGIKETTTTTGTGNLTLADTGAVRCSQVFQTGQLLKYSLLDSNGNELEWGIGTYLGSNTLGRTVVCGTFQGGVVNISTPSAVTLSGTTTVICTEIMGGSVPGIMGMSTTNGSSGAYVPEPMLMAGGASSFTVTADRLYLQPVRLASPRRLASMKFRVSTGGSGVAQLGLYKCSENGEAKELLISSGDLSLPASGVTTWSLTTPVVLPPDWYFIGWATKGVTPVINTTGTSIFSGHTPYNTDSTAVQPVVYKYATLTGGWTSLPTTAPTSLTSVVGTLPPTIALGMS